MVIQSSSNTHTNTHTHFCLMHVKIYGNTKQFTHTHTHTTLMLHMSTFIVIHSSSHTHTHTHTTALTYRMFKSPKPSTSYCANVIRCTPSLDAVLNACVHVAICVIFPCFSPVLTLALTGAIGRGYLHGVWWHMSGFMSSLTARAQLGDTLLVAGKLNEA